MTCSHESWKLDNHYYFCPDCMENIIYDNDFEFEDSNKSDQLLLKNEEVKICSHGIRKGEACFMCVEGERRLDW